MLLSCNQQLVVYLLVATSSYCQPDFMLIFYGPTQQRPSWKAEDDCTTGSWLWRSWQSGRFRHQRSAVRIPTSAIFWTYLSVNNYPENTKVKRKRPGMAQFKKKKMIVLTTGLLCQSLGHFHNGRLVFQGPEIWSWSLALKLVLT